MRKECEANNKKNDSKFNPCAGAINMEQHHFYLSPMKKMYIEKQSYLNVNCKYNVWEGK